MKNLITLSTCVVLFCFGLWPIALLLVSAVSCKDFEPPHLNWSTTMFRKRRTENGEQATEAGRDCLEVKAS